MKAIVPVISGKGGVGKSTVAVNLALAIAQQGKKTALIDCDFYGPSIPTMLGGGEIAPVGDNALMPARKHGIEYISLGFFLRNSDDAVIWRGPMFTKALEQMFDNVQWDEPEIVIVDMPPGTGDAQLSLSQKVQAAGAIVVTTPQEVALADVRKAINMLGKVNISVLGIVENMAGFVTPDGTRHDIFGSGGGAALAESIGAPLLASIPVDIAIREGGDSGNPAALAGESAGAKAFESLALKVIDILDKNEGLGSSGLGSSVDIVNEDIVNE